MTKTTLKTNLTLILSTICVVLFIFICSPKNVMANTSETNMDEDTEKIYQLLKTECAKIAKGEKTSVINISYSYFFDQETYTYEELGIENPESLGDKLQDKVKEIIGNKVRPQIEAAVNRMKIDCPYELYWFDRTKGFQITLPYTKNPTSVFFNGENIIVTMNVANDYQDNGNYIKVNSEAVQRANASIKNAESIVAKYASCTDEEKIQGYVKEIRNMTTYNKDAISATYLDKYGYGDPYQILSVFDNDSSTGTVCEGFAKAFQYLCNLSSFTNAKSYIATGNLVSNNVSGTHMWNIVSMNGKNYIVDVTNTTTPSCTDLVLAGAATDNNKYIVLNQTKQKLTYTYDADTTDLYNADLLNIAHTHIAGDVQKENYKAATCTTPESYDKVIYCKYCGEEISREAYTGTSVGHDYVNTKVARTCTTDGYTLHVCSKCGDTYTNSVIPCKGHAWDNGTENADTTVTYKCLTCGATKVEGTPKPTATPTPQPTATPTPKPTATPVPQNVNKAAKITLSSSATYVKVNKTLTIKAKVLNKYGKTVSVKLQWTVNNTKYAKISSKGVVTGLKAGKGKKVTVTLKALDGSGKKATKVITIK